MFRGDEFIALVISNTRAGLKKLVDVTDYSVIDFVKTTEVYYKAGFSIEFYRFTF
ncbi:hypothetical protein [Campylobacter upsaliensis]|uniref:hypothetical protein n=1 Tax=Campylobacter upsaliensis TaxID=28080 RepID=UPI0018F093B9|nr:hypothetical protein [Campylobacter upsaliensis]MBJ6809629.1 hypothetical protein [Campylobacter upsaliensis]